jgi:protein-L-isoaspartate(D-aspartate) O-methyltransferase
VDYRNTQFFYNKNKKIQERQSVNTEFAMQQMVRQQVRTSDVFDPSVLRVIASLPRQNFVPDEYRNLAFADTEIPLANGQRMMTPTIEGRLLQSLSLEASDTVMEIGTGSGFLTACLARLAASVFSIDIYDDFLSDARARFAAENIDNVEMACMDACTVLPDGSFDAIAVTGSIPLFDDRLVSKLLPGGRLFVVVGSGIVQEARLIVRNSETGWDSSALFETRLKPLVNCAGPAAFSF